MNRAARTSSPRTPCGASKALLKEGIVTEERLDLPGNRSRQLMDRKGRVVPDAISGQVTAFAARGEGALLWDADGRRYVDLAGGVGWLHVGHSHPPGGAGREREGGAWA